MIVVNKYVCVDFFVGFIISFVDSVFWGFVVIVICVFSVIVCLVIFVVNVKYSVVVIFGLFIVV